MRRAIVCLGYLKDVPVVHGDVIGVDYGAELLARHQIPMVCAIGDFDSTKALEQIKKHANEVIQLSTMKNETDAEVAILWALQRYDSLDVYGGLGGRMDHEYANLILLLHRKYPITLYNATNKIYRLDSGCHDIQKDNYHYISFFPLKESYITLKGVKYPLYKQKIDIQDIYLTSNEMIDSHMQVELDGEVFVIQSNDK